MLRGSSNLATRSWRNFRIRLMCCVSSLPSSRSAARENSIFQAMPLHDIFKMNGVVLTIANAFQRALGKIHVLEVFQVLQDSLAGIEAFCAPSAACKFLKTFFDGLRKSDSQHRCLAIQV